MKKISKTNSLACLAGVTLVELLIYIGLFMGFMVLLSGLFVSILQVRQESIETARIEQDSQYLYQRLHHDLNQSLNVIEPAENGAVSSSLVLETTEGEITYFLENNQLMIASELVEAQALSSSEVEVTQLSFLRLGNDEGLPTITAKLTLTSSWPGSQPETRELVYTFGTR